MQGTSKGRAMTSKMIHVTDRLHDYILDQSLREHTALARLRAETAHHAASRMQISPIQGQFMQLLVRLMQAKRTLEIGVFTGYSSLAVALALPPDGRIVACDVSPEYTAIARQFWHEAGVSEKIDLRLAPALETLDALLGAGEAGCFDLAFIDADKTNYRHYYERSLQLVRHGGLILIDNVLWGGSVIDPADQDEDTRAIRELNTFLHQDERVDLSMIPLADGLTLARKR